eukprot:7756443-Pyramimonas_sp.AAC.1
MGCDGHPGHTASAALKRSRVAVRNSGGGTYAWTYGPERLCCTCPPSVLALCQDSLGPYLGRRSSLPGTGNTPPLSPSASSLRQLTGAGAG